MFMVSEHKDLVDSKYTQKMVSYLQNEYDISYGNLAKIFKVTRRRFNGETMLIEGRIEFLLEELLLDDFIEDDLQKVMEIYVPRESRPYSEFSEMTEEICKKFDIGGNKFLGYSHNRYRTGDLKNADIKPEVIDEINYLHSLLKKNLSKEYIKTIKLGLNKRVQEKKSNKKSRKEAKLKLLSEYVNSIYDYEVIDYGWCGVKYSEIHPLGDINEILGLESNNASRSESSPDKLGELLINSGYETKFELTDEKDLGIDSVEEKIVLDEDDEWNLLPDELDFDKD